MLLFDAFPRPPLTESTIAEMTSKGPMLSVPRMAASLGRRAVVPVTNRAHAMTLVHAGHRVVAMKNCSRSYLWWRQTDKQIKETARSCHACQSTQRAPPEVPMSYWSRAWNRGTRFMLTSLNQWKAAVGGMKFGKWLIRPRQRSSVCCVRLFEIRRSAANNVG